MDSLEKLLNGQPLMPVIVIDDANQAVPLAHALLTGGLDVIEITFRTAAAADSIRRIRAELPAMKCGAGTVITPEQADAALAAGAAFALAPGLQPRIVERFQQAGVPFVPGVMTPTEIEGALALGCRYLKFFPAVPAGGAAMLAAMSAPYASQKVKFCPTGGVTAANMGEFLKMPSVFAVGGSWMATAKHIAAADWPEVTRLTREALAAARAARG